MKRKAIGFTRQEIRVLLLLSAVQFSHIVDFMVVMPLEVSLDRTFNITTAKFMTLISAYTLSAGMVSLLAAFFLDRLDRRSALLLFLAGFILASFTCSTSQTYEQLLLSRLLAGAFGGVLNAVVYAIVGDLIPYERRGEAIGIVMLAFSVATVAGLPFSLYLAEKGGWQLPFFLIAVFAMVVWLLNFLWLPSINQHLKQQKVSLFNLLQNYFLVLLNPNHLRAYLVMITMMFAGFLVIPYISAYLVRNVSLAETHLKYMYLTGGFASLFSFILLGRLADIYGKQRLFYFLASLSTLPLLAVTLLPPLPLWQVLLVTSLFFVLVSGRMVPAMALVTAAANSYQRGNFMSLNSAIQQLASASAAWLAGNIVFKDGLGKIQNFPYVGILAVLFTLTAMYAVSRLSLNHLTVR